MKSISVLCSFGQAIRFATLVFMGLSFHRLAPIAAGQLEALGEAGQSVAADEEENTEAAVPRNVDVAPLADDSDIRGRLLRIYEATGWFTDPRVTVKEGVVFLDGVAKDEEARVWAANLARNTQDVVGVVNRLTVPTVSIWDFSDAWIELRSLTASAVRGLPFFIISLLVLCVAWYLGRLVSRFMKSWLRTRIGSYLLRVVVARTIGGAVVLLGVYFILRISGLTRLAVTVLGGTGLLGLVIGIAFRDITENFLASIFLSLYRPFREGDLVEVSGNLGVIQRLTSRTTIMMTLDGNHVQIPNSTVFKSSIRNYTSNPNRREDFTIGIGYETPISEAQKLAVDVLEQHPAILKDPEPLVLVDSLGTSTVNLKIYFWLDGTQFSWAKVRSSAIRQIKRAFQEARISLPDEAREVIFPKGLTVRMAETSPAATGDGPTPSGQRSVQPHAEESSIPAEGGLHSEVENIEQQARGAWSPEHEENLLNADDRSPKKE